MEIAIPLFDRFTALDAVGPYQVMTHLPGAKIIFCAERPRGVAGDTVAQQIQLGIEYDPHPPFDAGAEASAPADVIAAFRARSRFASG